MDALICAGPVQLRKCPHLDEARLIRGFWEKRGETTFRVEHLWCPRCGYVEERLPQEEVRS